MAEAGETARAEAAAAGDGEPPLVRYSVDLFNAFGAVSGKAKSGVQSCQAVAAFIAERANMEAAYARALTKTAASAQADDWAPGFAKCWTLVHETLAALGKVHTSSAAKMQSTMVSGVRAFAAQQEIQVQRLIAEGTKYRTAHANIVHSVERAKDKYDKRCAEAQEIIGSMRVDPPATPSSTSNGALATAPSPSSTSATGGLEESKEIVGQLLTRMSSFTKPSVERQRSKLEGCLEELLVAEKHYTQSIEYANSKQIAIEREIAENLLAFQLTEEQRIEYLKDLLDRMHKLLLQNLEVSAELVSKLREGTSDINEFVDIEDGFRKLSQGDDSDSQVLDPADNAFYQRICEVQAMSDRGHTVLRNFHSTLADLMSIEDHFVSSAQRLLRNHDAPPSSSSDLFSLSTALSQVIDEGSTMKAGWQATKEQLQHLWQVHVEFRSLLAEPVALNIATMKQEYEDARTTTHDNFSRSHMALCQDTAVYQKLKQKLDAKCRDFAQLFGTLPDMGEIDLRNLDVTQVLELVHQLSSAFSDKEKRTEARLKALGEEVREAQQKVSDSTTALKMRSSQYIQDVDMFISVYMKNEKFRLQVEKSSLISLVKALEHMVHSATRGVNAAIGAVKLVDPIKDMIEFVEAHRQPRVNKVKKISPEYVDDEALKAAIDEYSHNKSNSSPQTDDKLSSRRKDPKTSPTPLKGTSANDSNANSIVSSLDEAGDGDLLGMSDFQKQFKLDYPEQVVESYSCALYANNFPNHGRMYLTSDHLCFSGWRDTIYVVAFLDISSLEKKNSALIVPNALEVTAKGEKVFFTSFVFRDECLQRIFQLKAIKMATAAALTDSVRPSIKTENAGFNSNTQANAVRCTSEAPVAPASQSTSEVSPVAAKLTNDVSDVGAPTSTPEPITPLERVIPEKDSFLDEYELLIDEEVPFSVGFAYKTIWVESSDFFEQYLERGGETAISITPWERMPVTYTAITKPDRFHGTRQVSYVHNKKYMVGPSSIPTMQTQRYAWDANIRLVVTITTLVSDAPYCDYFRAETRWVFSNTAKKGVCQLQVGISIQWVKSTWLKKQIENTALSEAKDYTRSVVDAAIDEAKKHAQASPPTLYRAASIQPSLAPPPQPKPLTVAESDIVTPQIKSAKTTVNSTSHARSAASAAAPTSGPTDNIKSLLQVANALCVVLFFFMMYRIGSALDQMQLIARETLEHQRQQQELFREILLKLHSRGR